jgi:hypothetical protein
LADLAACKYLNYTSFSVVLFRPNFMLFSEKNRMKMHTNQWLSDALCPLDLS